jgi:hypothetical protein
MSNLFSVEFSDPGLSGTKMDAGLDTQNTILGYLGRDFTDGPK